MTEEQRDVAASNEKSAKASNEPTESTKARRSGDPSKRAAVDGTTRPVRRDKPKAQKIGNPSWFVPVMLGLMLVGLIWVVTYYITQEQYPVESWGRWNLGAGFTLMMAGFAMTTRWK